MAQLHTTTDEITALLKKVNQLTIFGLKEGVSLDVASVMKGYGFDIIGIHPRQPGVGFTQHASLADAPKRDTLVMFRRGDALMGHLDEVIAYGPKIVWLQLGIENEAFTDALIEAGIDVVANRCIKVEYRHRL